MHIQHPVFGDYLAKGLYVMWIRGRDCREDHAIRDNSPQLRAGFLTAVCGMSG
jgi:hypothetical protein